MLSTRKKYTYGGLLALACAALAVNWMLGPGPEQAAAAGPTRGKRHPQGFPKAPATAQPAREAITDGPAAANPRPFVVSHPCHVCHGQGGVGGGRGGGRWHTRRTGAVPDGSEGGQGSQHRGPQDRQVAGATARRLAVDGLGHAIPHQNWK